MTTTNQIVINANGLVLGRLSAYCAKNALRGKIVEIINIDKAVISGNPKQIVGVFVKRRTQTQHANPEHADKWPRRPDLLFKRILKGMLPRGSRGREAAKRVKAYMGNIENKTGTTPVKSSKELKNKFIELGELCQALGWKHG